jgi:hypothetical protein
MKPITLKCFAEEWLFSRLFTYIGTEKPEYDYEKKKRKRKKHEPKEKERIPFLFFDEEGMMMNLTNIPGDWSFVSWSEIRTVTLYYTMNPWDCLSFSFEEEKYEREKMKHYIADMNHKYKHFREGFNSLYNDKFSLYLDCKKRNVQLQLPASWIDGEEIYMLKEIFKEHSREIELNEDEEFWKNFFD